MDEQLRVSFRQWDKQDQERRETQAHTKLSNLYLAIEAGTVPLTITSKNELYQLLHETYPLHWDERASICYWKSEFMKLPGWFDV